MVMLRDAIVTQLASVVAPFSAEVHNWFPPEYSKATSVCVTDCSGDINRSAFVSPAGVPFEEQWTLNVEITPAGAEYSASEALATVTNIVEAITTYAANNLTFGISEVVRAYPSNVQIELDADSKCPVGLVEFSVEFRITRSRS